MKKPIKLILLFVLSVQLLFPATSLAADATQSSKNTPSSKSLVDKIHELEKSVASRAAILKFDISKKLQNKAYVGLIYQLDNKRWSIQTESGQKSVTINEYTLYEDHTSKKSKKSIADKDFLLNEAVACLGDVDDNGVLTAKKVIKLKPEAVASSSAQIIWGQIQSISGSGLVLKTWDSQKLLVTTHSNTDFRLGKEEASLFDAKITKFLTGLGIQKDDRFVADFIYYIPSVSFIKPDKTKIATKSAATIATATPSAKVRK